MQKLKIIFIGPKGTGKTSLANFLADATESGNGEYRPTMAVRILEFETHNISANGRNVTVEVELWDCSGEQKRLETSWPALQQDNRGIVLVYDPNIADHARELERLYNYFVAQAGLNPKCCLLLAHPFSTGKHPSHSILSNTFARVPQVTVNIDESANKLRSDFAKFLSNILNQGYINEREQLSFIS